MDINLLRAIITVVAFATFLGIVIWTFSGARRPRFEDAARTPFDGDDGQEVGGGR